MKTDVKNLKRERERERERDFIELEQKLWRRTMKY